VTKYQVENRTLTGRGEIRLTRHAEIRKEQRCIPPFIVDALVDFGDESFVGRGCTSYSFSRRSWKSFTRYMGKAISAYEKYRSVYLVLSDHGDVVTIAWRH